MLNLASAMVQSSSAFREATAQRLKSLLERVKGIEPSYSAWKSPNSATRAITILTFCSVAGD
jgi:hypothetical protein